MLAAIYCRLSVEDKKSPGTTEASESIQNQELLLENYAHTHQMQIYAVYIDDNYSGLDNNRPAFLRLLEDARHGRFQIILCKSQSRFTRDMETADLYLNQLFPIWGIRFLGIVDGTDTDQKHNKKTRQINALVNEWYCEDLSENIKTVLRRKMQEGQYIGSFASYGYTKSTEDHHRLIPDPPAAAIVRRIFESYLQGHSIAQIANILTKEHIPRPSQHKKQCGLLFQAPHTDPGNPARPWSVSTVKRILSNPIYTGTMVQGREQKPSCKSLQRIRVPREHWVIVENTHPPLISTETFWEVQKQLAERRKKKSVTHLPPLT